VSSRRSAIQPVQAAVFTHLAGDTTLTGLAPVYDQVPQGTSYPYVEITELVETLDNTEGQQGRQVMVTVSAWDQTPGYKPLELILDNLLRLLDEDSVATLGGSGWTIWHNEVVRDNVVKEPDGITRQLMVECQIMITRDALGE
jgi:uncharacterized protein DUF3168